MPQDRKQFLRKCTIRAKSGNDRNQETSPKSITKVKKIYRYKYRYMAGLE